MNSEALRLFDKYCKASGELRGVDAYMIAKELRALLSAQEVGPVDVWTVPLPQHWRKAIGEWGHDPVAGGIELETNLAWIERRAGELAKQEAK